MQIKSQGTRTQTHTHTRTKKCTASLAAHLTKSLGKGAARGHFLPIISCSNSTSGTSPTSSSASRPWFGVSLAFKFNACVGAQSPGRFQCWWQWNRFAKLLEPERFEPGSRWGNTGGCSLITSMQSTTMHLLTLKYNNVFTCIIFTDATKLSTTYYIFDLLYYKLVSHQVCPGKIPVWYQYGSVYFPI